MIKTMKNLNDRQIINSQCTSYLNYDESPSNGIKNISIFIHKARARKRKKYNVYTNQRTPSKSTQKRISRCSSLAALTTNKLKLYVAHASHSGLLMNKSYHQNDPNYFVDLAPESSVSSLDISKNQLIQTKWIIYRCQLSAKDESCCCSCNSDTMFEVMKSLYDCYKKKNCDHCNCILCGHLPREERDLGGIRKTLANIGVVMPSDADKREKSKKALSDMVGKSGPEKEKILRDLAMANIPLPEPKTPSERDLHKKVRRDLGLPPEPTNPADKAKLRKNEQLGIAVIPLEGKTPQQKEKILRALADKGIPLPEGRTPSEKSLINKINLTLGIPVHKIPSEKIRKAKAAGLITPLQGKTPEQREKILKGLAGMGIPFPEGKTPSEKKLIDKVRLDLGLPPEPKTPSLREKYNNAANEGALVPLEGKTPAEKEKILQGLANRGIPLPEGRTPSEKALVAKVKARPKVTSPSEKMRNAKAAGLLTPLKGKPPQDKERILRGLAMLGLPLPEGKSKSEKDLIDKVRRDLGLPPEPTTPSIRDKHNKAANDGVLLPLEGRTPAEKEKILRDLFGRGIPLPEGRTPSEKALIAKIKQGKPLSPSEKMRNAKAAGLLTPLKGKPPEDKERILRGLAMLGLPLPEGKTKSEKDLIDKVRGDLGLPPEPKTPSIRDKHNKAANDGVLLPLEGRTPAEKEKILRDLFGRGIPLPEGRTPSEKALIAKIKQGKPLSPSEKMRNAKAAGLLTPLKGKPPEDKERILRGLAMLGLPLPEGKTKSEKDLIDKVRGDLGLPPEPQSPSIRDKHNRAANDGVLLPLEGRTPAEKEKILRDLFGRGIPLPQGRTSSEKALIAKIKQGKPLSPSEKMRNAKAAGLLTPLKGKPPEDKERILRGLAMLGLPLPEGKTKSEKDLIDKVRGDLGLPPEPTTPSIRDKHNKAANDGVLLPLEGRTPAEKEKILRDLFGRGIPLPEGRTPSEKALIARIKRGKPPSPSEKMRNAKAAGLLTPLKGKPPEDKERILRDLAMLGLPLPEGKTKSEKDVIDKVRRDLGLPPEPTTPSIREKLNKAANDGVLLPLEGRTPAEKDKILRDLFGRGIPLPEGRTSSEKALIAKIKLGKPLSPSEKMRNAKAAGLLTPLKGKPPQDKERILRGLAMLGLPLPEGKTKSEKDLIDKVRGDLGLPPEPTTPSIRDKHNKAANDGVLLPLEGRTPAEKDKILRDLFGRGIPLPEGRTPSEKALIAKIKRGSPTIPSAGLLSPLEGKSPEQKEKILRGLAKRGLPLPESKTPSEKKLIDKVRTDLGLPPEPRTPSLKQKYAKARDAGLIQPLEGKTPAEKEKILKGLANMGVPLPEGRTPSEKAMIAAVKKSFPSPKGEIPGITTEKIRKAKAAGLLTPLEGKSPQQKDKILRSLAKAGYPLPEGKTASDKALIRKIKSDFKIPEDVAAEKMRKVRAAGLVTPMTGKTPAQKEKILRSLAAAGLPLPEGKTPSEKALVKKVKADTGYKTPTPSERMKKAQAAGLLTPLKGKTPEQQQKALRARMAVGIPLPEGTTPSEKDMLRKLAKGQTPSQKMQDARAAGLLTPLQGKTPEQKEKIMRGLAKAGLPLPELKTPSDRSLANKIRHELGLPPEPSSPSLKERYKKAQAAGIITPLEGKRPAQKEKILKDLADAGIPLPEGRTPSEKAMANKIRTEKGLPPPAKTPSEKEIVKKAKADGLLTPIAGKAPKEKERILRGLANAGLPLPIGTTASEKALIKKVRADAGLPLEPTPSEKRGRIKKKGKKVGAASMKAVGGVSEEFEDIIKTTKCDRGCGCDKKKIRFKHSYVKIRVTSPDFSSICACPDECFPRIKNGVMASNEGIKVIVGSVVGVPSYSKELTYNRTPEKESKSLSEIMPDTDDRCISTDSTQSFLHRMKPIHNFASSRIEIYDSQINFGSNFHFNESLKIYSPYNTASDKTVTDSYEISTPAICENYAEESDDLDTSFGYSNCSIPISITVITRDYSLSDTYSSRSSIRTESSLKSSTSSSLSDIYRESSSTNNLSYESLPFVYRQKSSGLYNNEPYGETSTSGSDELINKLTSLRDKMKLFNSNKNQNEFLIFRVTQSKVNCFDKTNSFKKRVDPLVIINDLNNNSDVVKMVDELLSKRDFSDTSLFLVVPSSDEDSIEGSELNSTICIQETNTDSNCEYSKPKTSVIKQSPIGTTLKEEYHDVLLNEKRNKEYSSELSASTVNDNKITKDSTPGSDCKTPSKKQLEIITIKDRCTKKTSNTSTAPSIRDKKTKKTYFKHFSRNKHAMKNRAEVISTSASSLDRRPKKSFLKWKRRSASHGRQANKQFKKDRLPTTQPNDKSLELHKPLQVQVLFQSVKRRCHKRCQVAAPKTKANRKAANTNDKRDSDHKLNNSTTIYTQVSSAQCGVTLIHDMKMDNDIYKKETNVFQASAVRNVCPLHGINWNFDQEFDTDINNEYMKLGQPSERAHCPVNGHNNVCCQCGSDGKKIEDKLVNTSVQVTCECEDSFLQTQSSVTQDSKKPRSKGLWNLPFFGLERKVKDVDCQCWPSEEDNPENTNLNNPQKSEEDIRVSTKSNRSNLPYKAAENTSCSDQQKPSLSELGFDESDVSEPTRKGPEGLLLPGEYHDLKIVYIRDIMKMFSECSQTTSRFTLNVLKKPVEPKPSYKEVLDQTHKKRRLNNEPVDTPESDNEIHQNIDCD